MERAAVEKAKARLQKAKHCIARIKQSKNYADYESAWVDLLIALNTVHCALEQGAKSSPQSRQWYGGKKQIRTKDPLLNYLHQARNADEHGIEPIAEHRAKRLGIRPTGVTHIKSLMLTEDGKVHIDAEGDPLHIKVITHVVLIPVFDRRFNTRYDPPTSHLGAALPNDTPLTVGRAGIAYHEGLIAEAETLIP
jgi:hypothetical protein